MMKLALCLLLLAVSVRLGSMQEEGRGTADETSACPLEILKAIRNLTQQVQDIKERLTTQPIIAQPPFSELDPATSHPCGGTLGWRRVAYLNMSDTRYHCPAGWRETGYPVRTCGRASSGEKTCDPVLFNTGVAYTKVCGRVVGYQFGATAAFRAAQENRSITIDESYVTGVSITHGNPREHLWTYAAGQYEPYYSWTRPYQGFCPCEHVGNIFVPPFVGAYWFCESGDNERSGTRGYNFFPDDPLWDGEGCRQSNKCCQHEGPLYLVQELPNPTTDPIEVRICNRYSSQYSDVPIELLELYVK